MNVVTISGRLAADPDLRFTGSGQPVANLRIAHTPRRKNPQGQWEDGTTLWLNTTVWGKQAENITNSLAKGMAVLVVGRLQQRNWQDKNTGENRSTVELIADSITPDLRYATAQVTKNERNQQPQQGWGTTPQNTWQRQEAPF